MPDIISSLIAGETISSGKTAPILNPHDNSEIARLSLADAAIVDRAVRAAKDAQAEWAATPAVKRGEILFKACALIEERSEELSKIVAPKPASRRATRAARRAPRCSADASSPAKASACSGAPCPRARRTTRQ